MVEMRAYCTDTTDPSSLVTCDKFEEMTDSSKFGKPCDKPDISSKARSMTAIRGHMQGDAHGLKAHLKKRVGISMLKKC